MTSAHDDVVMRQDPLPVERRLQKVCKKLSVNKINIGMFHQMVINGVATNDVRKFAHNQQNLNRHRTSTAAIITKTAMRQKLKDAYSTANKLKYEKKMLEKKLSSPEIGYSRSKTKRVVKKVMMRAGYYRNQQKTKIKKKYALCKEKMNRHQNIHVRADRDIPENVWRVLKNINVFNKAVQPELPADPMICSKDIKISKCELAFLRKGPKFMLRS